jgi:hypothetical protein
MPDLPAADGDRNNSPVIAHPEVLHGVNVRTSCLLWKADCHWPFVPTAPNRSHDGTDCAEAEAQSASESAAPIVVRFMGELSCG